MYTLTAREYIVTADHCSVMPTFLRDCNRWEDFNEKDATEHFANIYALFLTRVRSLSHDLTYLSLYEEKELRFMLDALIQAKRLVQDSQLEDRTR